jgi:3-hydroxyacyl-[acyl-carrier-protein] dehydratase
MMLQNDFYHTQEIVSKEENSFRATIKINPQHKIFEGHFPGKPVVPGVCLIQILKELVCEVSKKQVVLQQADNIKFLAVINPNEQSVLTFALKISQTDGAIQVKNVTTFADTICFKFGGSFK